jgi:hypothetical protein
MMMRLEYSCRGISRAWQGYLATLLGDMMLHVTGHIVSTQLGPINELSPQFDARICSPLGLLASSPAIPGHEYEYAESVIG